MSVDGKPPFRRLRRYTEEVTSPYRELLRQPAKQIPVSPISIILATGDFPQATETSNDIDQFPSTPPPAFLPASTQK